MQKGKMHYHFAKFNAGFVNSRTEMRVFRDKARSGRPREAVTSEKIAKVDELVNDDPHITTTELATQVGISRERITHILRNELDFHKVCAKWVPHKLSEDNKRLRVEVSKQLLETLKEGYNNIITGDETWIYFFTVSSKEANKVWIEKGKNRPQIVRTAQNSKKKNVLYILYRRWGYSTNCNEKRAYSYW